MNRLVVRTNKTIRKKAYEFLRERLLAGEIPPHEHLVETKIARQIGTSRTPVREALHSLEMEGLLKAIPRIGYVVVPISEEEVEEICEIRAAIESLAAKRAAKKAQAKLVAELRKNIADSEDRVDKGDIGSFVGLSAEFHEIIAKFSKSKRLLELSRTLRRHMFRYRVQSIYRPDTAREVIAGHKKILEAIERGNPEEITQAIHDHMEESRKAVFRYAFKDTVKADD